MKAILNEIDSVNLDNNSDYFCSKIRWDLLDKPRNCYSQALHQRSSKISAILLIIVGELKININCQREMNTN